MAKTATSPAVGQGRFLAVTAVGMFLSQNVGLMLAPLLVDLAAAFDVSVAAAGQLAAVTFGAWAISVVSSGPISDSFGRRPVAVTGLALLGLSTLASGFAPSFAVLLGLRVVTGLTGGIIPPNSMAAVADVLPPAKRARAFGRLMAFTSLSSVIGAPFVAAVASAGGWRVPFLVIGSLLLVCAVLAWFWYPRTPRPALASFSFLARYKQMAGIGLFRSALAANFLQRVAFYGTISYLAAFLISEHGLSVGETAAPLAVVGIGVVVGSTMAGTVSAMERRAQVLAGCVLAGGLAFLVLFALDLGAWGSVGLALVGVTFISIGWPTFLAISTEISGASQATAVGMLGASNQLGGVGGAALGGAVLALGGFSTIGFLCFGAALVSAMVLQFGMRRRPPSS
ncbi:MAG: MFS transporter [Chloroflexi bacterium]|nr:MFS transporter [Chloroflexota bacterium]MDA1269814.1 MFS transporter [Chloroflexota bacterium]